MRTPQTRMAVMLMAGALLLSTVLNADNGGKSVPARKATTSAQSTTRQAGGEKAKFRAEVVARAPENEANPAFPFVAGTEPFAPTVCSHNDVSRDFEFRACMSQILDAPNVVSQTGYAGQARQ